MPKNGKPVIIDCDPGVDDAAAILLALSHSVLDIRAITTVFGNVGLEQTTKNALKILEVAERREIPVYKGAEKTFDFRDPETSKHIHGEDGLGNNFFPDASTTQLQEQHAVPATIEMVNKHLKLHNGKLSIKIVKFRTLPLM